jgi:hypothetical protein
MCQVEVRSAQEHDDGKADWDRGELEGDNRLCPAAGTIGAGGDRLGGSSSH